LDNEFSDGADYRTATVTGDAANGYLAALRTGIAAWRKSIGHGFIRKANAPWLAAVSMEHNQMKRDRIMQIHLLPGRRLLAGPGCAEQAVVSSD
jgi:hypothetical protein